MANNPYANKVQKADGTVIMDISSDTVTPSDVLNGVTFHDRSGAPQTGSLITHNVYDGLDSTSTSDALSAKQGKILNEAKANKVTSATNGNFAALDSNGNLTDSGYKYSDFAGTQSIEKAFEYTSTTETDTGIVVDGGNTMKRKRLYNSNLSMANGTFTKIGSIGSGQWVLDIRGFFRLNTAQTKCYFLGKYFSVRWDTDTGDIYVMQEWSSSTISCNATIMVDYFANT